MHNEIQYAEFENFISAKLKTELNHDLHYHGFHHTEYVLSVTDLIAKNEGLSDREYILLKTAIWLHDSGFLEVYMNHEEKGCEYAKLWLPKYGYTSEDISKICGMIMATKVPQRPQNLLENIIADADLEYLGTDKYEEISETLYKELVAKNIVRSEEQWGKIQVGFLSSHNYHTKFCKENREANKQSQLARLIEEYDTSS